MKTGDKGFVICIARHVPIKCFIVEKRERLGLFEYGVYLNNQRNLTYYSKDELFTDYEAVSAECLTRFKQELAVRSLND